MADGVKKINEWIMKEGRVIGITKDIAASKFEGGTFFVHPNDGVLKYNNVDKAGNKSWQKFLPIKIFDDLTIKRSLIDNKAINESKLEDGAITTIKIKDNSVSNSKLQTNSVTTEKIKDLHVTTEKINNYAVTEHKILDSAISTSKIKNLAVTSDKLASLNVTNNHIAEGTIKNSKLFNKTITNEKIADGTLVTALYKNSSITSSKIGNLQILSNHIADLNVETKHIKNRAVTGAKVAQNTLKDENMIVNSINADKLTDGSIVNSKYKDLSISGRKLENNTIDISKLENNLKSLITDAVRVDGTTNTATVNGNLKVNGNIDAIGNITGAKVFNPVFADIAEAYIPTVKDMTIGQAVCLTPCGGLKVEPLTKDNSHMFIGFISDQYAACYGATPEQIESGEMVAVALTGRIPVKMDTTNKHIRVGAFITIEQGKIVPNPHFANLYCKPTSSVGRIIDIIDEETVLIQV